MTLLEQVEREHQSALAKIATYRNDSTLGKFTDWLLSTDQNPWSFLDSNWASQMNSAQGVADLLDCLHHALVDDGDVEFAINKHQELVIVFENRFDDDFDSQNYKVLDIDIDQFGELRDQYELARLQQCFAHDSARFGVDWAVEHYQQYQLFSKDWPEVCALQIEKWRKIRSDLLTWSELDCTL